jgi:hypothetical protein
MPAIHQRHLQGGRHFTKNLVLKGEDVVLAPVKPLPPDLPARRRFEKACPQSDAIPADAHAGGQDMVNMMLSRSP